MNATGRYIGEERKAYASKTPKRERGTGHSWISPYRKGWQTNLVIVVKGKMFERVYLINLKRRPDRLEAFRKQQLEVGWKLPEPILYRAIEGDKVGVPSYYVSGGGAWGCCRSHVNILEQCLMENVRSVLIFEDDVCWKSSAWDHLEEFMKIVPDDWKCLFLGGQHSSSYQEMKPGVVRVTNIGRTHAYAVRGDGIKKLLALWYPANKHIDHLLAPYCKENKVYAPEPFIFGQGEGDSDISGKKDEGKRYWSKPPRQDLILWLHPELNLSVVNELRDKHRWHRGNWLDSTGRDNGLARARGNKRLIAKTVETLQWEVMSDQGTYVAIWHPSVNMQLLRESMQFTQNKIIEITGPTVEECLNQLEAYAV